MSDALNQKSVLLVEDEPHFRQIYKDALTSIYNFHVSEASDGQETLKIIQTFLPDVILLDLILPKKDGFDVIRSLKNDNKFKEIPIIVYSVLTARDDIDRALKLGANDYAIKGSTPAIEVFEKVKRLVDKT